MRAGVTTTTQLSHCSVLPRTHTSSHNPTAPTFPTQTLVCSTLGSARPAPAGRSSSPGALLRLSCSLTLHWMARCLIVSSGACVLRPFFSALTSMSLFHLAPLPPAPSCLGRLRPPNSITNTHALFPLTFLGHIHALAAQDLVLNMMDPALNGGGAALDLDGRYILDGTSGALINDHRRITREFTVQCTIRQVLGTNGYIMAKTTAVGSRYFSLYSSAVSRAVIFYYRMPGSAVQRRVVYSVGEYLAIRRAIFLVLCHTG